MDVDASGSDARKGVESPQSWTVEHEHWKFGILQYVTYQLDAIPATVKNGVSVSAACRRGLHHISLQLAQLAASTGKEASAWNAYANSLTARQGEIMLLLDMGMRPKAIAQQLTLSEATVRTHIRNARRALDSKSALRGSKYSAERT